MHGKKWMRYSQIQFMTRYGSDWIIGDPIFSPIEDIALLEANNSSLIKGAMYKSTMINIHKCIFEHNDHQENCSKVVKRSNAREMRVSFRRHQKSSCVPCQKGVICRVANKIGYLFSREALPKIAQTKLFCAKGISFIKNQSISKAKKYAYENALENLALKVHSHVKKNVYISKEEGSYATKTDFMRQIDVYSIVDLKNTVEKKIWLADGQIHLELCMPHKNITIKRDKFK